MKRRRAQTDVVDNNFDADENNVKKSTKALLTDYKISDRSLCGLYRFECGSKKGLKTLNQLFKLHSSSPVKSTTSDLDSASTDLFHKYGSEICEEDYCKPGIKSILFDRYDNDLLTSQTIYFNEHDKFLNGCIICNLISRTIWLLTVNERALEYCGCGIIEKEQCPFGNFYDKTIPLSGLLLADREEDFDVIKFTKKIVPTSNDESISELERKQHIHTKIDLRKKKGRHI